MKQERKEVDLLEHERIFGRVPPHNPKAPRVILQLTDLITTNDVSLANDKNFQALKMIEGGIDLLMKIEDLIMCENDTPNLFTLQMGKALDKLSGDLVALFKGNLKVMTAYDKGKQLKAKASNILPLLHRQTLISLK